MRCAWTEQACVVDGLNERAVNGLNERAVILIGMASRRVRTIYIENVVEATRRARRTTERQNDATERREQNDANTGRRKHNGVSEEAQRRVDESSPREPAHRRRDSRPSPDFRRDVGTPRPLDVATRQSHTPSIQTP